MAQRVGMIGLGAIGKPIVERILAAGHRLAVNDIRSDPFDEPGRTGAAVCASPAEVVERSDLVISLVLDDAQTDEVLFGERGIVQARWKEMLDATPTGVTPPNLRKNLHAALELGHPLGVPLFLGTQASLIADSGIATGHDNPAL